MTTTLLKKATRTPETDDGARRTRVAAMLRDIETRGEAAALEHARALDGWEGPARVPREALDLSLIHI